MVTWETTTIGELLDFKNGLNKGKEFFGEGTPIVNYMDVYKHRGIRTDQLRGRVTLSAEEIKRFDVRKGDVFFTRTSETPEEIGYTSVMLDDIDDCVFSGFVLRGRPITDRLVIDYCQYAFMTEDVRKAVMAGCTYTTRALTNGKQLSAIEIQLPDKPEQRRIAAALSDTDALIIALEKLIAKKRAIKQGAMQELLTGKRRLPGFEGEWVETTLGKVALDIKTGKRNNEEKIEGGKYAFFVRSQQVERIDDYSYDCEAILVPGEGNIGLIFHYINDKFDCHQRVYKISNFSGVDAKFIYFYLMIFFGQYALINTVKATVDSLRLPTFVDFRMSIPLDITEQTAIAEILSDMDAEIDALSVKLNKLRNIKQGMMSELLTGNIRLIEQDANVEVAEELMPEVKPTAKPEPKGHNQQFDDAVMIAGIVNALFSEKYPLGRKKVQKCLYLLRRHQDESTAAFKKKAAGPYADQVRYKGGEPIAQSAKYISRTTTKGKGTTFARGSEIGKALGYIKSWDKEADIQWVADKLKFKKVDELELLATVDMAICDLTEARTPVSVASIKHLIATNAEWKAKLKRQSFSDDNIAYAIDELQNLMQGGD